MTMSEWPSRLARSSPTVFSMCSATTAGIAAVAITDIKQTGDGAHHIRFEIVQVAVDVHYIPKHFDHLYAFFGRKMIADGFCNRMEFDPIRRRFFRRDH